MIPSTGSAAILCIGGLDVIRKEAWPFYRTISGVRLHWALAYTYGERRFTEAEAGFPQKALRGGIPSPFLEPFPRFCQHLARIAHVS